MHYIKKLSSIAGEKRVAIQQSAWFTPLACLGLLQVCSWGRLSTCRSNWNLILALFLLFTSSLVLCTHLALLKMGICAGVSAGNTLPLEGRVGRGSRCYSLVIAAVCGEAKNISGRWWCVAFFHHHQGQSEFGSCCVSASEKHCK